MLRSIASNWSLNALQMVVFIVLWRYTALVLGDDWGIWELITSLSMPLQLLALGLPMATVRAVSVARGRGEFDDASAAVGTSLSLTLVLGVVAAGIGVLIYGAFSAQILTGQSWESSVSDERAGIAKLAMIVMLANVAAGFALRLPYAIYEALDDFVVRNLIMGSGILARLVLTYAMLSWRPDLFALALVQIAVALLEFIAAYAVSRIRHPQVHFRPRRIDRGVARNLLSFSMFAFLLNMGALLAFKIDAIVIGWMATAEDIDHELKVYGFGNKIFDPMINMLLAVGMVLMPLAAAHAGKGNLAFVRDAFFKWSRVTTLLVLLMGGYLMVLGPEFLAMLLEREYEDRSGDLLRVLMASFLFFLPIRSVALPVLMGLGRAKAPGLGLLAMGIVNLALSLVLIRPYGLMGVALGTAIPNVVFSAAFAAIACRSLEVPWTQWASYSFGKPTLAALAASGALWAVTPYVPHESFVELVLVGVGYTALFGVIAVLFVYRGDPHVDVTRILDRLPGRK